MDMRDGIIQCFQNLGILIDPESEANPSLSEYLDSSMVFVSFIVELEQYFDIEISDEYLIEGRLSSYADVELMLEELISKKK